MPSEPRGPHHAGEPRGPLSRLAMRRRPWDPSGSQARREQAGVAHAFDDITMTALAVSILLVGLAVHAAGWRHVAARLDSGLRAIVDESADLYQPVDESAAGEPVWNLLRKGTSR